MPGSIFGVAARHGVRFGDRWQKVVAALRLTEATDLRQQVLLLLLQLLHLLHLALELLPDEFFFRQHPLLKVFKLGGDRGENCGLRRLLHRFPPIQIAVQVLHRLRVLLPQPFHAQFHFVLPAEVVQQLAIQTGVCRFQLLNELHRLLVGGSCLL